MSVESTGREIALSDLAWWEGIRNTLSDGRRDLVVLEPAAGYQDDRNAVEALAARNPNLDYYTKIIVRQPKREIGEYVAAQGFNVPIIRTEGEWHAALQDGTAFLRSEMPQDYLNYAGVFTSKRLTDDYWCPDAEKKLCSAYRAGQLSDQEYMEAVAWEKDWSSYYEDAAQMELPSEYLMRRMEWSNDLTASRWQWLGGLTIRMFRDPVVDGRYHFGTTGTEPERTKSSGYIDKGGYDEGIQRRDYSREVPAGQVIDLYESIRGLSRFDQDNAPLMELQSDEQGELHFLQYYKTPHKVRPVEPFDVPSRGTRLDYVRGVTPEEGVSRRLYLEPRRFSRSLVGQAVYVDMLGHSRRMQGMLSRHVDVILSRGYPSLRGTHDDQSLLYGPRLMSAGIFRTAFDERLRDLKNQTGEMDPGINRYIDITIVANGHEAVIDSDFEIKIDAAT